MRSKRMLALIASLFLLHPLPKGAEAAPDIASGDTKPIVYLASLEWPPFTSATLPAGGTTAAQVSKIFQQLGYQVQIDFLPWSRAVYHSTGKSPKYLAYFPEYPLQHDDLVLSGCVGFSHLGLAERVSNPVTVYQTADLANYHVGVVQDYVNTTAVDELIANNQLAVSLSLTDQQNLLRLAHGRLDTILIDRDVMNHLLQTEPSLMPFRGQIRFNNGEYELKTLHVAFNKYHPQFALLQQFNTRLYQTALSDEPELLPLRCAPGGVDAPAP